jgi:hypothetical protein
MSQGILNQLSPMHPKFYISNDDRIMKSFSETGGANSIFGGKFFYQRWQPFIYACIIGLLHKHKIPFENRVNDKISPKVFDYQTIISNGFETFISIILCVVSLSEKGYDILSDPQEINNDISEYANGGFEILNRKLDNGEIQDITYFLSEVVKREDSN